MKYSIFIVLSYMIACLSSCSSSSDNNADEKYPHTKDVFFLSKTIDDDYPEVHASINCEYDRDSTLWVSRIEDISMCKNVSGERPFELSYCPFCSDSSVREQYDSLLNVVLKQKEKDLALNLVGKWYVIDEKDDLIDYLMYFSSRLNTFIMEKKVSIYRESSFVIVNAEDKGWTIIDRSGNNETYKLDPKGNLTVCKNDKYLKPRKCDGMFQPELFDKYTNCNLIQDYELKPLTQSEIMALRTDSIKWIKVNAEKQELKDAQHKKDIYFVMNIEKETNPIQTKYDVNTFLRNIEKAAKVIKEEIDPKTKKELTSVLAKYQKKNFPIARKVFAQSAKKEMWRDDIDVRFTDKTITFTSADFYRNAVIEDCFKQIRPYLEDLRFKSASFIRGYSGDGIKYPLMSYSDDLSPCIYMKSQR